MSSCVRSLCVSPCNCLPSYLSSPVMLVGVFPSSCVLPGRHPASSALSFLCVFPLAHIPLFSGTVIPSALSSPASPAVWLPLSLAPSPRSHPKQPGHSAPSTGVRKDILFSVYFFAVLTPAVFCCSSPCVQYAAGRETLFFPSEIFFFLTYPVTEEALKTFCLIFLDFLCYSLAVICGPDYCFCCSLKSLISTCICVLPVPFLTITEIKKQAC